MGKKTMIFFVLGLVLCSLLMSRGVIFAAATEDKRTADLIEGAKKEGKVVWYTAMSLGESVPLLKKFNEKYPFVTPEIYRSGAITLLNKILSENQARQYIFDVATNTFAEMELLNRKGFFAKYDSPQRKFFPEGLAKDTEGHWTDIYSSLNVISYNTKMVSRQELPKTYEDLLKPRWKGKMGMDTKAYTWFAGVLIQMGEKKGLEYMKRLGGQDIQFRTGRTLNAQMVAAGEMELGITTYNHRVEEMKAKGAPIDWLAIEPIIPELHPLSISIHAPHPNAARLLVDFLLSREGQNIVASVFRVPSRMDVDPIIPAMKKGLKIMNPNLSMVDDYNKHVTLFRELLMKK